MKIKMRTEEVVTVAQGYERFIAKCKANNLSNKTITYYEKEYVRFCNFCETDMILDEITDETIKEYIFYLKANTNANDVTIATYIRAIRAIFYYLMKMGYMKKFDIIIPKAEKKIKETYTDAELALLLKKPNMKECSFVEYRTWVYINYLLATGNRVSTAISVKIKDLDFENQLIKLEKTKNKRQQIIPMANSLKPILLEYLNIRGGEAEDYVFCTETGTQMKIRSIEDNVKFYNNRRGVTKTSSHLFRHTFAKKWILAGGDVFRLQKMLGHYSIEVTKEYVQMFGNDLQLDFDRFNPLDNLQNSNKKIYLTRKNIN